MKNHFFKFAIPLVLILVSVIVSFNVFLKRMDFDSKRNVAQYALNEAGVKSLLEISGNDLPTMLAILKDQVGITAIIVPEYTIQKYEEMSKLTVLEGYKIINTLRVGQLYRTVLSRLRRKTSIKPNATYIIVDEVAVYKRIIGHLKLYLPRESVIEHSGRIIQVNMSKDRIMSLPIGFESDFVKSLNSFGFNVVPELKSYDIFSKEKIELTFNEISDLNVSAIKFNPEFRFSEKQHMSEYINLVKRNNLKLIFPEFSKYFYEQFDSFHYLASNLSNYIIISHGVNYKRDQMLSFDIIFERYMRALTERSPQLVVFPVNDQLNIADLYDKNILFMKRVIDTYARSGGTTLDYFTTFPQIKLSFLEKLFIALGVFSAFYLLIIKVHLLKNVKQTLILFIVLLVLLLLTLFVFNTVAILGALTAIIAPIFAMVYCFPYKEKVLRYRLTWLLELVKFFVLAFAICSVAVLVIIALYSEPMYLNNIQPFWGVKISLLVPILLVGFYYFCGPLQINSFFYVLRRLLRLPITYYGLLISVILLFIIMMYLFRSGNYLALSNIEQLVRSFLQDTFVVRPRFKEFLIGYPALIFSCWLALNFKKKDFLWLFNGLGVIGLSSFINSFCHFHTPVMMSIYRSIIGFVLGLLVAFFIFVVVTLIKKVVFNLGQAKLPS
ncbi:MAG: DUF5693 family protein [Candidatus Margulisiibacteriota bacterium]|nr:DUF5693 family protein [Candidatus Margulisiibacteriota bacterium]